MSKVIIYHAFAKDTFPVSTTVLNSGWMPGQLGTLNSAGTSIKIASTDETMFLLADSPSELNSPPTGSLVTCIYGAGTKVIIDHSQEVQTNSSNRAYESDVENALPGQSLYVSGNGKFTTVVTGSVYGKVFQVPSATNNYGLGVILRF
uniref:Uncharacterized protein n=1 Tax=Dictyoglomus turgidum TaxID=513050 RepID=A0A7C3WQN5_9BACT